MGISLPPGLPIGSSALRSLRRLAQQARFNNPRYNAAMTSPPTITAAHLRGNGTAYLLNEYVVNTVSGTSRLYKCSTAGTTSGITGPSGTGTGIADGTAAWDFVLAQNTAAFGQTVATSANSYLWNDGAGAGSGVFNLYGGVITNDATHNAKMLGPTVAGTRVQQSARVEFVADSARFWIRIFNTNAGALYRLIVNGQYVSTTPVTVPHGAWNYLLVDFSSVGGRLPRNIILEMDKATCFAGVDVLSTEGVYKPGGDIPLKAILAGDSYAAAAGVTNINDGFQQIIGDYLGIRNMCGVGIGSTGLLVSNASGTALSRVSDITTFAPDIIFVQYAGSNDMAGSTSAQIAAAMTTYLQAIRADGVNGSTPIFCMGMQVGNRGTATGLSWLTSVATETAIAAAITALNDPRIFFIPITTNTAGTWMTGTGDDATPASDGNSDLYISHTFTPHPNVAGNVFLAGRIADAVQTLIRSWQ